VEFVRRLRKVGKNLHVLKTLGMTMGGKKLQDLLDRLRADSAELEELVEQISTT
jgi:hypothetical protein